MTEEFVIGLVITFFLAMGIFAVALFVLWILMVIDCVKRNFKNENDKIVWILFIIL